MVFAAIFFLLLLLLLLYQIEKCQKNLLHLIPRCDRTMVVNLATHSKQHRDTQLCVTSDEMRDTNTPAPALGLSMRLLELSNVLLNWWISIKRQTTKSLKMQWITFSNWDIRIGLNWIESIAFLCIKIFFILWTLEKWNIEIVCFFNGYFFFFLVWMFSLMYN